ncbi:MAG: diacylglycerol kinase [Gemmataceae bacterium]
MSVTCPHPGPQQLRRSFPFSRAGIRHAVVLECNFTEWCLLLMCAGGVLTAELFNSAIETLFRGLDESMKPRCWQALDIAAGAVLAASITAALPWVPLFSLADFGGYSLPLRRLLRRSTARACECGAGCCDGSFSTRQPCSPLLAKRCPS